MKNQYVGDINDYHKYGLLRILTRMGAMSLGVCWMLTPDDGRADGGFTDYLRVPHKWRSRDPALFDSLSWCVSNPADRGVGCIEASDILPNAQFHSDLLPIPTAERRSYFAEIRARFVNCDLVFFDPDNGLEVKSCPPGCKRGNKYLYWSEVSDTFSSGHSVLIYQHFPRARRDEFVETLNHELAQRTGACSIVWFRTSRVVFLLAMQSAHRELLEQQARHIEEVWSGQIQVDRSVEQQS